MVGSSTPSMPNLYPILRALWVPMPSGVNECLPFPAILAGLHYTDWISPRGNLLIRAPRTHMHYRTRRVVSVGMLHSGACSITHCVNLNLLVHGVGGVPIPLPIIPPLMDGVYGFVLMGTIPSPLCCPLAFQPLIHRGSD